MSRKGNFIGLRITDEAKADIQRLADEQDISFSECVRNMIVKQNDAKQGENVKQLEKENEHLKELLNTLGTRVTPEADKDFRNGVYTGLKIVPVGEERFPLDAELKDTLRMVELSSSKEDVPLFLKDLHDRLESGELRIENGKLKLGYSEVYQVLNTAEVKKWLRPVWNACEEKGRPYMEGLRAVFKHGASLAVEDLYGDRQ